MINDMRGEEGFGKGMAMATKAKISTESSEVERNQKSELRMKSPSNGNNAVEHQIETEFDLDPLPEREDFHWFSSASSSSNNDISLAPLRNSVFLARRVRHPHKSVQVSTASAAEQESTESTTPGHVIIPSTRKTNSVTFAPVSTAEWSEVSSSTSTDDRKIGMGDKNCNCAHQLDCVSRRSVGSNLTNTNSMNLLPHFTCNNFRDSTAEKRTKGLFNSQRRSVSLPEKVWNELVNRSRKRKSKQLSSVQQKLGVSSSTSASARSSISPAPALIEMENESTTRRNPGISRRSSRSSSESSSHRSSTSSISNVNVQDSPRRPKKIENVSDVTNGGESVKTNETQTDDGTGGEIQKTNGSSEKKKNTSTKWRFFKLKRSRSAGANSTASPNAVNVNVNPPRVHLQRSGSSSDGSFRKSRKSSKSIKEKDGSRKLRPVTIGGGQDVGSVANFFRSFRVKKNKVGNGRMAEEEGTGLATTSTVIDPGDAEPSHFVNRRRVGGGGRSGINTNIFSSFYQAGRKHFSPKDLDDVTLDLASGELMKTNDGTVIEKSDVVDVVTTTNEGSSSSKKPSSKKTKQVDSATVTSPKQIKQQKSVKKKKKNVLVLAVAMTLPPSKSPVSSSSSSLSPRTVTGTVAKEEPEGNTTTDYPDLYATTETKKNPPCETLSSTGGDSSTSSSNTGGSSSSRGSQTEHFPQQHLQEQNQHLRLSPTSQQFQEESENSFPQSKSLFGKVKELGSKSRRRFSHKHSSGNLVNGAPANDSSQPSSLNFNNFDEVRKSMGEGHGEEDQTTTNLGNEMTTSTTGYRTRAVDIIGGSGGGQRNSSEEELISITNSQSGGLGSLSLSETEEYLGPFVGKAVALVDCVPSPYDRHALRYKKGDLIEIISKKPTGLWTGKVNGQVGHFKFINVEILLPDESDEEDAEDGDGSNVYDRSGDHRGRQTGHSYLHVRRRNKRMTAMTPWEMEQRQTVANVINGIRKENAALSQHSKSLDSESPFRVVSQSRREGGGRRKSSSVSATSATAASLKKGRPKSVGDLLRRINLEEYISVFILHGFESLDLFKELEEEDLDRLSIRNQSDRAKILTVVELLREFDSEAEIPPIIIPTYSCPSQLDGIDDEDLEDRESDLHRIIAPPANFTRTAGSKISNATMVRDSGVFVKCDDQEDPEIEEIILSPVNLRIDVSPSRNCDGGATNNPSIFLGRLTNSNSGNGKAFHLHSHPMSQIKNQTEIETQESMTTKGSELWPDNVEQYCAVRQRFLQAKSLFESGVTSPGGTPQSGSDVGGQGQKNRFLFCEKSSDSGISVGANSPPPTRVD